MVTLLSEPIDKTAIIKAAIPLLADGVSTEVIAKPYGITGRTLRNWLINDPEAEQARTDFLTNKLMQAAEDVDSASDTFPLARARESFKAWSWIAERRLPSRFGAKQDAQGMSIVVNVASLDDVCGPSVTIEHEGGSLAEEG